MFNSDNFFMTVVLPVVGLGLFFVILASIPIYFISCKQAKVYNIQNGTNWSCSDFFWAGEQINSKTQTIKLN